MWIDVAIVAVLKIVEGWGPRPTWPTFFLMNPRKTISSVSLLRYQRRHKNCSRGVLSWHIFAVSLKIDPGPRATLTKQALLLWDPKTVRCSCPKKSRIEQCLNSDFGLFMIFYEVFMILRVIFRRSFWGHWVDLLGFLRDPSLVKSWDGQQEIIRAKKTLRGSDSGALHWFQRSPGMFLSQGPTTWCRMARTNR
jgi:hypothetical protein